MRVLPTLALIVIASLGAFGVFAPSPMAQFHGQHEAGYADLMNRTVKALSEAQTADLRAGRGMGLALAAELNGYPGPSHVLELAQQLGLDEAQRIRVRDLFDAMKRDAVAVGEQLVALESELDIQFATRAITLAGLERTTSTIGERQVALRAAHLRYHLLTTEVLTPDQLTRYAELRGYRAGHGSHDAERN